MTFGTDRPGVLARSGRLAAGLHQPSARSPSGAWSPTCTARGRLLWYLPYIFTDSEQTVATGREIFGYPKQLGYFDDDYPEALGPAGGVTTVQTLAIDPFGPDEPAIKREMIRSIAGARRGARSRARPRSSTELGLLFPERTVGGYAHAARPGGAAIGEDHPPGARRRRRRRRPAGPWIQGMLSAIEGRTLTGNPSDLIVDLVTDTTLVFLKQFRDVSCATKACYQAVIEAPLAIEPLGASYERLDPGLFELTIQQLGERPGRRRARDPGGAADRARASVSRQVRLRHHARSRGLAGADVTIARTRCEQTRGSELVGLPRVAILGGGVGSVTAAYPAVEARLAIAFRVDHALSAGLAARR